MLQQEIYTFIQTLMKFCTREESRHKISENHSTLSHILKLVAVFTNVRLFSELSNKIYAEPHTPGYLYYYSLKSAQHVFGRTNKQRETTL